MTDHNDALLEAIVSLGHSLDMTMLAEGIETAGQLERVRTIGCELGQGFLWSEAVVADNVVDALRPGALLAGQRVGSLEE